MRINLCEIIEMPGKSLPFSLELDTERLSMPSVLRFLSPPKASGLIINTAGAMSLEGEISAELILSCDRCAREYEKKLSIPVFAKLSESAEEGDDPELFPIEDNHLDLTDLLETSFILSMEQKSLCDENCAGLCERCGKNLNDGPCGCKKEIDPRLAVLGQLLDKPNE